MFIRNWNTADQTRYHALYAQDQWTVGRITLQGALRYDHAVELGAREGNGWGSPQPFYPVPIALPAHRQRAPASTTSPTAAALACERVRRRQDVVEGEPRQVPPEREQPGPLHAEQSGSGHAIPALDQRAAGTTLDRDFVPDCDLMNPAANGECGAVAERGDFGNPIASTINPEIFHGWGVRPSDWQFGASVQREVLPRDLGGGRLPPPLVPELPGHRQPGARCRTTSTVTRSRRRSIPTCRAAAATRSAYLDPRDAGRRATTSTFEKDYGDAQPATGTASTST